MTERHVHQWDQCSACGALRAHVPPEDWRPIATAPTQTPVPGALVTLGTDAARRPCDDYDEDGPVDWDSFFAEGK